MYLNVADDEIPAIVCLMCLSRLRRFRWLDHRRRIPHRRPNDERSPAGRHHRKALGFAPEVGRRGPGRFVGCVWLEPIGDGVWYLGSLAVDPDRQNSGLGRAMLVAAEEWVRQRGAKRVRMTVINIREALIAWYTRRGYAKTGATDPFPYGDDRFGRPLREDLCFVVLEKSL
jgi:GNAT superfamily N-acetyltransferase